MADLHKILSKFDGVKGSGTQYAAKCPAHDDKTASLSIGVGSDRRILFNCHAGCSVNDICSAVGISIVELMPEDTKAMLKKKNPKIVATYEYRNGTRKHRMEPKSFWWEHKDENGVWSKGRGDAKPCLYGDFLGEEYVFLVEGEKDVDTLLSFNLPAVSSEHGAGDGAKKWSEEYTSELAGKTVFIIQDNDRAGKSFANAIAEKLAGKAKTIKILDLAISWPEIPEHGDVTDWIMHTKLGKDEIMHSLYELQSKTSDWKPEDSQRTSRIKRASEFERTETSFIWYPYLPVGDYTVVMAPGGVGKTTLICGIAAAISMGRPLPGNEYSGKKLKTLIYSSEDDGGTIRAKLEESIADPDLIGIRDRNDLSELEEREGKVFSFTDEGIGSFEEDFKTENPDLVIIDPWHAFLGASVDMNRANAVRPVLRKVAYMAKKYDFAMILISHVNKRSQSENANDAATGSADFINAARSAVRVIQDEEDEDVRLMVHTKSNHAKLGQTVRYRIVNHGVKWEGFSDVTKATLEEAARTKSTPAKVIEKEREEGATNTALIDAIRAEADEKLKRFSYDRFKAIYGDNILGTSKRKYKKTLKSVKPTLIEMGITLELLDSVADDDTSKKGFSVIRTTKPEG